MSRIIVNQGKKLQGRTIVKKGEDLTLNGLKNVNIDNPQNNDVLVFNSATGKWVSRPDSDIQDLANVNIDCGFYGDFNTTSIDCGEF